MYVNMLTANETNGNCFIFPSGSPLRRPGRLASPRSFCLRGGKTNAVHQKDRRFPGGLFDAIPLTTPGSHPGCNAGHRRSLPVRSATDVPRSICRSLIPAYRAPPPYIVQVLNYSTASRCVLQEVRVNMDRRRKKEDREIRLPRFPGLLFCFFSEADYFAICFATSSAKFSDLCSMPSPVS